MDHLPVGNPPKVDELLPEQHVILSYCVGRDARAGEREALVREETLEQVVRESADAWHISSDLEETVAEEQFRSWLEDAAEQDKEVGIVEYIPETEEPYAEDIYVVEDDDTDYLFVPRNVSVQRVSQNVLGPNVLGRTWPGTGSVEVASWLQGDQFREVLQHELNHVLYPHLNEREVREKTREQVNEPRFH